MKNISIIILLSAFFSLTVFAQEKKQIRSSVEPISNEQQTYTATESDEEEHYLNGMVPVSNYNKDLPTADSLHLPTFDNQGRVFSPRSWYYPYLCSFGMWDIHEGLNVQMGLSAFTSFGKGSFSGWGQNISAVYAKPVTDRLSIAVGGFMNNYSTGRGSFRSAGITAVLNYRFNEHWEAYVYGQKSFVDNNSTMFSHYGPMYGGYGPFGYGYGMGYGPMYDMGMYGDRIGAGVTWKPSESTTVQVQFEYSTDPRSSFHDNIQDHWEMPTNRTNDGSSKH